jgi:putative ABC transport system ATP-binding protein
LNEQGLTVVLITHENDIAQYAKRQVHFRDGLIVQDEPILVPRVARDDWAMLAKGSSGKKKIRIEEES